ncbi:MAG: DUF2878 domain-containing protein [Gammaproteobacteria bacterium]|nr:DUF2878 domain-containing protein [Gammaproteobacteria bacterium]
MTKSRLIANFILFQLGWFACVLLGAGQLHWLGSLIASMIVLVHLQLAERLKPELMLVLSAVVIGLLWDSALVWFGVLQYEHGLLAPFLAPHWIVAMWALFATTINGSLGWVKTNWLLAALMGAVGGPLSFYAGYKLGAVQIPDMALAMALLAAGWAVFMPLLVGLSQRLDGVTPSFNRSAKLAAA